MRIRLLGSLLAFGVCTALLSAAVVCAQPPAPLGEGEFWGRGKGFEKCLKKLNLTAEQKSKLDTQRAAQRDAMKTIRQSIASKRQDLRAEMDKDATDKAKIDGIAAELKNLEGRRVDQQIKGILQMKEVLTPEQFKQLSALREGKKGRKHGWWKKHSDPEGQPACGSSPKPESGSEAN